MGGNSGIVVDDLALGKANLGILTLSRLERSTSLSATRIVDVFRVI